MAEGAAVVAVVNLITHLGKKVIDRVIDGPKDAGVALDRRGTMHPFTAPRGGFVQPQFFRPAYGPTDFLIQFDAEDPESHDYLDADQPVLLLLEDEDPYSDLDGMGLLTTLGEPVESRLPPGSYNLAAIVFFDDDLDEVDGFGWGAFEIEPGEEEFVLTLPILGDTDGTIAEAFDEVLGEA